MLKSYWITTQPWIQHSFECVDEKYPLEKSTRSSCKVEPCGRGSPSRIIIKRDSHCVVVGFHSACLRLFPQVCARVCLWDRERLVHISPSPFCSHCHVLWIMRFLKNLKKKKKRHPLGGFVMRLHVCITVCLSGPLPELLYPLWGHVSVHVSPRFLCRTLHCCLLLESGLVWRCCSAACFLLKQQQLIGRWEDAYFRDKHFADPWSKDHMGWVQARRMEKSQYIIYIAFVCDKNLDWMFRTLLMMSEDANVPWNILISAQSVDMFEITANASNIHRIQCFVLFLKVINYSGFISFKSVNWFLKRWNENWTKPFLCSFSHWNKSVLLFHLMALCPPKPAQGST